jgi:thioester reductase-like protein
MSLSSPFAQPAHLLFCSSVGTAMATPAPYPGAEVIIPETPINDVGDASPTGYARSKLIAERMLEKAVAYDGARATVLRIGQIIPSPKSGSMLWNQNEMIPLMVHSALSIGVLPNNPSVNDQCSWIDVDSLSRAILDIGGLGRGVPEQRVSEESQLVYNLVHPRPFSWRHDFLPALKVAGLDFEAVERQTWLEKLNNSEKDIEKNPSRKLLTFWKAQNIDEGGKVKFETIEAESRSEVMQNMARVVDEEYVAKLLHAWRTVW